MENEKYENELKNVSAIIHLAAVVGSNNKELNFKTNVEGTRRLIESAKKNKIKRIIFVSTISASYSKRNNYAESKLQAEKLIHESGMAATVIRPNLIIGKNSPQLKKISDMTNLPVIPVVGSGKKLIQPISVDQLSQILLKTIENEKIISHTITVSGSEALTFNKFLDKITMSNTGKTKIKIHMPIFVCNILAALLEIGLGEKAPINKGQIILINQDSMSSFNHIKQLYDLKEISLTNILEGAKK